MKQISGQIMALLDIKVHIIVTYGLIMHGIFPFIGCFQQNPTGLVTVPIAIEHDSQLRSGKINQTKLLCDMIMITRFWRNCAGTYPGILDWFLVTNTPWIDFNVNVIYWPGAKTIARQCKKEHSTFIICFCASDILREIQIEPLFRQQIQLIQEMKWGEPHHIDRNG